MLTNLSARLKEYLPKYILELIINAGNMAQAQEQRLFLVGGIVRDILLNQPNSDIDLIVEGDAVKLAMELARVNQVKMIVHHRFRTARLNFSDFNFDLATSRKESYSKPGALPIVEPGIIMDDLQRRDFSVNAMAINIMPGDFGELIDLYGGLSDIDKRIIRILHSGSFIDDATRMFRAIRYEQRLGFIIDKGTLNLLQGDLAMIDTIGGDRLRHELELILREEFPERILSRADELGILRKLHLLLPGKSLLAKRLKQAKRLYKKGSPVVLYLCLMAYNMTIAENEQFIMRLNFQKKSALALQQTLYLKAQLHRLNTPQVKPSDIYQLLCSYVPQAIEANMISCSSTLVKDYLSQYLTRLCYIKPLLTGDDLMKMGIDTGPQIGEILAALYEAKLNNKVKTRVDEERLVKILLKRLS